MKTGGDLNIRMNSQIQSILERYIEHNAISDNLLQLVSQPCSDIIYITEKYLILTQSPNDLIWMSNLIIKLITHQYSFGSRSSYIYNELILKAKSLLNPSQTLSITTSLALLILTQQLTTQLNRIIDQLQHINDDAKQLIPIKIFERVCEIMIKYQEREVGNLKIKETIRANICNGIETISKYNHIKYWTKASTAWMSALNQFTQLLSYSPKEYLNARKNVADYLLLLIRNCYKINSKDYLSVVCQCYSNMIDWVEFKDMNSILNACRQYISREVWTCRGFTIMLARIVLKMKRHEVAAIPPSLIKELNYYTNTFFQVILDRSADVLELFFKYNVQIICCYYYECYDTKQGFLNLKKLLQDYKSIHSQPNYFLLQSLMCVLYRKDISNKTKEGQKIVKTCEDIITDRYKDNCHTYKNINSNNEMVDALTQVTALRVFFNKISLTNHPDGYQTYLNILYMAYSILQLEVIQNNQYFWKCILQHLQVIFNNILAIISSHYQQQFLTIINPSTIVNSILNQHHPQGLIMFATSYLSYFDIPLSIEDLLHLITRLDQATNAQQPLLLKFINNIILKYNQSLEVNHIMNIVKRLNLKKIYNLQILNMILDKFSHIQELRHFMNYHNQQTSHTYLAIIEASKYQYDQHFIIQPTPCLYLQHKMQFIQYRVKSANTSKNNLLIEILELGFDDNIKYDSISKLHISFLFARSLQSLYRGNVPIHQAQQVMLMLLKLIHHNQNIFRQRLNYKQKNIPNWSYQHHLVLQYISQNLYHIVIKSQSCQNQFKSTSFQIFKQVSLLTELLLINADDQKYNTTKIVSLSITQTYLLNLILVELITIQKKFKCHNHRLNQKKYLKLFSSNLFSPSTSKLLHKKSTAKRLVGKIFGSDRN